MPPDRWSEDAAGGLEPLDQLVYRSHLLGREPSVVNYGGGNTSAKAEGVDHRGRRVDGMFLAKHGLVTWGATGRESYQRTVDILTLAESFLEAQIADKDVFGGEVAEPASTQVRRDVMVRLLPVVRGELSRIVGPGKR